MPTLEEAKAAMHRLEDYMYDDYKDWREQDCPDNHIIRDVITLKAFIETL